MQLILSLLLTSFTTALAAPTTNTTSNPLSKRATYGWVSSYAPGDTTCSGFYYAPSRPKIHADCVKFSPVSDNVGINWGTWPLSFGGLDIFKDEHCKEKAGDMVQPPKGDFNNPTTKSSKGAVTCFSVNRQAHTGKIGSVKGYGVYFD